MNLDRDVLEKGDFFEIDSRLVKVIDFGKLPVYDENDLQTWREAVYETQVQIEFIDSLESKTVLANELNDVAINQDDSELLEALGFKITTVGNVKGYLNQELFYFAMEVYDRDGFESFTKPTITLVSQVSDLKYHHDNFMLGFEDAEEEFSKNYPTVAALKALCWLMKNNSLTYDENKINNFFVNKYLKHPLRIDH